MQRPGLTRVGIAILLVAITVAYGWNRYNQHRMDRLYVEATDPTVSRGSKEAQAAVRGLGAFKDDRSTQMLLSIALGQTPLPWPDVQREAIVALASRNDPSISAALANVLQPHHPFPVRQAAAEALRTVPCSTECVRAVLHYLERVWAGEPNYEDRTVFAAGLNESVKADHAKEQAALFQTLSGVLRRERTSTLNTLGQVYGLGTNAPSEFSLTLVTRIVFRDACAMVLQSEQHAKDASADSFVAPREELEATVRSLKCH